jgi:hypothetical protein
MSECSATLVGPESVIHCQETGDHTEHRAEFDSDYVGCEVRVTAVWDGPPVVLDLRDERDRWKPWNGLTATSASS